MHSYILWLGITHIELHMSQMTAIICISRFQCDTIILGSSFALHLRQRRGKPPILSRHSTHQFYPLFLQSTLMRFQFSVAAQNLPAANATYRAQISIRWNEGKFVGTTEEQPVASSEEESVVVVWNQLITPASAEWPNETPLTVQVLQTTTVNDEDVVVATAHFGLQQLTGAWFPATASFAGNTSCSIALHAAPLVEGRLSLHLAAQDLPNMDFGFSLGILRPKDLTDAFCEVYSAVSGKMLAKTEVVPDNLNPIWNALDLELDELCGDNKHAPVRITVLDQDNGDDVEYLGQVLLTVTQLLEAPPNHVFPLVKGGSPLPTGGLMIQHATLHPSTRVSRKAQKQLKTALLRLNAKRDQLLENLAIQQAALEQSAKELSLLQAAVEPLQVQATRLAQVHNAAVSRLATLQEARANAQTKAACTGTLMLTLRAENLPDKDFGIFNKSDPVYDIILGEPSTTASTLTTLVTSNVVKNNLNPVWKEQTLKVAQVGDLHKPLRILVSDHDRGGRKTALGSATVTLQSLINAATTKVAIALPPSKKGRLYVVKANLQNYTNPLSEATDLHETAIAKAKQDCAEASQAFAPVRVKLEEARAAMAAAQEKVDEYRDALEATRLALDEMGQSGS